MLSLKETAIKKQISEVVLRTWITRHGLPVIKIGAKIYIEENDYVAWIESKKKVSTSSKIQVLYATVESPKSTIAAKMRKIY